MPSDDFADEGDAIDLDVMVTHNPSVMLSVTNIPSINCNGTLFCSELNGQHAGKSFMSPTIYSS